MVAEARDLDAELLGGPDEQRALGHRDLEPVDGDGDQVFLGRRSRSTVMSSVRSGQDAVRRPGTGSRGPRRAPGTRRGSTGSTSSTGLVAPSPSAQNERPKMLSDRSSRVSMSSTVPSPVLDALEDLTSSSRCPRGTACTCRTTRARRTAVHFMTARTTQSSSSKIITADVPLIEPALATESKSSGTSRCSAVSSGRGRAAGRPELQPACRGSCRRPSRAARAAWCPSAPRTGPGFLIRPDSEKIDVPGEPSGPSSLYQSAPPSTM